MQSTVTRRGARTRVRFYICSFASTPAKLHGPAATGNAKGHQHGLCCGFVTKARINFVRWGSMRVPLMG